MPQQDLKLKPIISILLFVAILFSMIIFIGKILIPFIVALILTYILNPIVEKIHYQFKIKRFIISFVIAICVFLLFIAIPLYVVPSLVTEVQMLLGKVPTLVQQINSGALSTLNHKYGTNLVLDLASLRAALIENVYGIYKQINIFSPLARNSMLLVQIMAYIILIPFILFYSICNWHNILQFFDNFIPRSYLNTVHEIVNDIDRMLSAYLRGQFSVMLIMAAYYAVALHFVGITSGFIVGLITGIMVFIPYLGVLTGLLISLAIVFVNFHGMHQIFAVLSVFVAGHLFEGGLITPYLVGGKIGLNPILIILALMIFGKLFGFIGILLALPLATITVALLRYAKLYYIKSQYYNEID